MSPLASHALGALAFLFPPALQHTAPSATSAASDAQLRARPHSHCADSITDRSGGPCLRASSTPTSGLLFPYPGANNTFAAPAVVAGGTGNAAGGVRASVGGGLNNAASGDYSVVAGGSFNGASQLFASVGGGAGNAALGALATIGGGDTNTASGTHASVGGGYYNDASGTYASIAGGSRGYATGPGSSIGGGYYNGALGGSATVAGGRFNTAATQDAAVGGGSSNQASASHATVAGGTGNVASGTAASVPGGRLNRAQGSYSFAAGRRAKADHAGAFVWGDSFDADKTSSSADEFTIYASGGTRIFSNTAATTGVLLASGAGTWSMVSDRDAKEDVEPVDGRDVLERLAGLEISTWTYRSQAGEVRHMGPMAQDFHAAFGLGLGEKTIDSLDPSGVALAAIQGLQARLAEDEAEITRLRSEVEALRRALEGR